MNPNEIVWQPSEERITNANITKFCKQYSLPEDYAELHKWSNNNLAEFWSKFWDFANIIGDKGERIIQFADNIYDTKFFPDAKINFCENLVRKNDDQLAIISCNENTIVKKLTFAELNLQVAKFADALQKEGVGKGDCVAGLVANTVEPIIAMLATQALGAVWSSCSPDFGITAIHDRFGQINPKVIVACNAYSYNQKVFDINEKIIEISKLLESTQKIIIYEYESKNIELAKITNSVTWDEFINSSNATEIPINRIGFSDPGFILFSSGTTGKPKCIVHKAAGLLLKQLSEHILNGDIKANEIFMYFTTCGWMMWNWQVSALALNNTLVIYDGSPFSNTPNRIVDLIDELKVNHFGIAPKYFTTAENFNIKPKEENKFKSLRTIYTAGSPLLPHNYEYIYKSWKEDVHLASISGGTDICGLFVSGVPTEPVKKTCIQVASLGCDIAAFDENANDLINESGELVCKNAIPSMPVGFLHDEDNAKYKKAYFNKFPKVWTHGDWVTIYSDGQIIITGRSDATLNPSGIRIGTADIYRIVDGFKEIEESLAVGKDIEGDQLIILFVRLAENCQLDDELIKKIKLALRSQASVRHVPHQIFAVADFPRTRSGKTAELAVKAIINQQENVNTQGLANPEILSQFNKEIT